MTEETAQKAPGSRGRTIRVNGRTPSALSKSLADSAFARNDVAMIGRFFGI